MRSIENYINKAIALAEAGSFATKAAKKDATDYLNRAYEMVRDQNRDAIYVKFDEELAKAEEGYTQEELLTWPDSPFRSELGQKIYSKVEKQYGVPFDLHNVRQRHIDNVFNPAGCGDMVKYLMDFRADIKEMPVVPKPKKDNTEARIMAGIDPARFAERPLADQAFALMRDMDPEEMKGFRSQHSLTADVHWVTNAYGTSFHRYMFYLNGSREALMVAMSFINADFEYWLVNGKPSMTGWTPDQIKSFYEAA